MDLTPSSWKKSEVTTYKQYVKPGMKLFTPGRDIVTVIESDGYEMTVSFEGGEDGDFGEAYRFDNLQIGWKFMLKDMEFINEITTDITYHHEG